MFAMERRASPPVRNKLVVNKLVLNKLIVDGRGLPSLHN